MTQANRKADDSQIKPYNMKGLSRQQINDMIYWRKAEDSYIKPHNMYGYSRRQLY
jgi:hypothetical protein